MEAKGVPLSERMTAGRPNSRKVLMNTGLASSTDVEYRPLHSSRKVKSRVVCKSERKLLDASVRLRWRPPSVREA